jgi:phytoene dehydrogenase-like protein
MNYISSKGGTVLLNHLVTAIILEGDKAAGIRYQSLRENKSEDKTAYGKELIANASIPQVAGQLLPEKFGYTMLTETQDLETAPSLLTVYFGFNKKLNEIGFKNYSLFRYDDSIRELADIFPNNHADFDKRSFTFVDYSQIDSKLAPEGKAVGSVCCNDYTVGWENLSKKEYQGRKEQVAWFFINRLEKLIPGFKNAVEYYEVGTAQTVKRYTLNPNGAVYGFAQTPLRVKTVINCPVKNLYFASAWSKTGGGYSGAIYSGYFCAQDIIRKRR